LTARSLVDLPESGPRHVFHRAALRLNDGAAVVALAGSQSSASHFTLARTNAFLVQLEETGPIGTGDSVRVQLLADIGGVATLTGRL
jgi:molybdopterin biosynthesis enzyme